MTELIETLFEGRVVRLLWRPDVAEITDRIAEGFVPIEMAEGLRSFVDFRCLDHHNEFSHLPATSVTALKHYGELADGEALLMVNHTDADCVMAGMTLLGVLPLEVHETLNPEIGLLDVDPMGATSDDLRWGDVIRLWKRGMASQKQSGWSWLYGLALFRELLTGGIGRNEARYRFELTQCEAREVERRKLAMLDYERALFGLSGRVLLLPVSRVAGFDVQFFRRKDHPSDSLEGWRHWCIAARVEKSGGVTLSCLNSLVAELAFGPGGLKNVYNKLPMLDGKGWGGREAVGGSPRGIAFPTELLPTILEALDAALLPTDA